MMFIVLMIVFTLIGVAVALGAWMLWSRTSKETGGRLVPLALLGGVGGFLGGLSSFLWFGYGRAHDYLYGYTHVYESPGATLPAFWMSFIFALIGALLLVALYRLIKGGLAVR